MPQPRRIAVVRGVAAGVGVAVDVEHAARVRVELGEAPGGRLVVAGAHQQQAGGGVDVAAVEGDGVVDARRRQPAAPGLVAVVADLRPVGPREGRGGALPVAAEVAEAGRAADGEREAVRVAKERGVAGARLQGQPRLVVPVVGAGGVDGAAGAPALAVVAEGEGAAGEGARDPLVGLVVAERVGAVPSPAALATAG